MSARLTVYESLDSRERYLEDHVRFIQSRAKLEKAGIILDVVQISAPEDICEDSDAREELILSGMDILPVTEYDGVVVDSEEYPSDQILADYLDAPNGLLSADKTSIPASNDQENCCCVCFKR